MDKERAKIVMAEIIALAQQAALAGEVPVAAAITDLSGAIIAQAENSMKHENNPIAHAEMRAIAQAQEKITDNYFTDYCLFVTLEPCPMCAHAIALARFHSLYFAAYDVKGGGVDHGARIFAQSGCNHIPHIIGGLCEAESQTILTRFFSARR